MTSTTDPDSLRTRIVAAVYKDNGFGWGKYMCEEAADAVIRELGLMKAAPPDDYRFFRYPPGARYITDWLADE